MRICRWMWKFSGFKHPTIHKHTAVISPPAAAWPDKPGGWERQVFSCAPHASEEVIFHAEHKYIYFFSQIYSEVKATIRTNGAHPSVKWQKEHQAACCYMQRISPAIGHIFILLCGRLNTESSSWMVFKLIHCICVLRAHDFWLSAAGGLFCCNQIKSAIWFRQPPREIGGNAIPFTESFKCGSNMCQHLQIFRGVMCSAMCGIILLK